MRVALDRAGGDEEHLRDLDLGPHQQGTDRQKVPQPFGHCAPARGAVGRGELTLIREGLNEHTLWKTR